jgi:chaperone BCS1
MADPTQINPQTALLDVFFPGFSIISTAIYKYSKIDLNVYFPALLALGIMVFASQYVSTWFWEMMDTYLMSTADIRIDDEMYNMLMAWVASQQFAKRSRRFVANTNLNSRMWFLWREFDDEREDENVIELDENGVAITTGGTGKKQKKVQFTPSFGTHYFWYNKRLLIFRRQEDTRQTGWGPVSEREQISISCFGRNPVVLKQLLDECRMDFLKNDVNRTVIYRGGLKSGTAEPTWTRCVSRVSRPFSTVVLDEAVKQSLLDDMRDYLHPYTRRWYSNRGIPYRRGYLLYGPPGTGKSSLSFAIAGYFKLKIYIVSLNSPSMNEENLGTLFSELPKQCVVLLEDIDTAGLTHTRKNPNETEEEAKPLVTTLPATTVINPANPPTNPHGGRISLSALLNILDGVASQEGRVLIMTTNHLEKLDEALIRPGRVDMTIKFDLANTQMITTIFRSIFATLEGDIPASAKVTTSITIRTPSASLSKTEASLLLLEDEKRRAEEEAAFLARKKREEEKVLKLSEEFANLIPTMTFSPAEIQGYLLKHKRQPELAIQGAEAWVEKMKEEKKKKAKEEKEKESKESEKERKEKEAKAEEERIFLEVGV